MRFFKLKSAVLPLLLCVAPASFAANTFGTDYSDLWWNPAESGWGVNLTHQGNTVFAVIYVYRPDGTAQWYSGAAASSGTTHPVFTGQLFEGRGTYFGAPFNPSQSIARGVGTVTLDFPGIVSGTMSYTIDGVAVTKSIQRQTFGANNMTGSYIGGSSYVLSGCGAQPTGVETSSLFTIAHNGNSASMSASLASGQTCNYTGQYTQAGRMGDISGTMSCTNGSSGTYHAYEIESGRTGIQARYTIDYGTGCSETGTFAGLKRAQ